MERARVKAGEEYIVEETAAETESASEEIQDEDKADEAPIEEVETPPDIEDSKEEVSAKEDTPEEKPTEADPEEVKADEELDDADKKSAYDIDKILEEQIYLREDLEGLRAKLLHYETMEGYSQLNERIVSAITGMDGLIDSFSELQDQVIIPDSLENFEDSTPVVMDRILFELLEIESNRGNFTEEVETMEVQDMDDIFNFGISISNIGPKIDFIDAAQADPSPMNMRLGIFAQLYNDDYNSYQPNLLQGLGAYQVTEWVAGQYIIVEKKENWWGAKDNSVYSKAYPDKIIEDIKMDKEDVIIDDDIIIIHLPTGL